MKIGASAGKSFHDVFVWWAYYTPVSVLEEGLGLSILQRAFFIISHCVSSLIAGLIVAYGCRLAYRSFTNRGEL